MVCARSRNSSTRDAEKTRRAALPEGQHVAGLAPEGDAGSLPPRSAEGTAAIKPAYGDAIAGVRGRFTFDQSGWFVPRHFDIGTGEADLTGHLPRLAEGAVPELLVSLLKISVFAADLRDRR